MAEDYKKSDDHKPRRLGEYLTCSRGSIVIAMKKKLEALERGDNKKGLGEFLLELGNYQENFFLNPQYHLHQTHHSPPLGLRLQ